MTDNMHLTRGAACGDVGCDCDGNCDDVDCECDCDVDCDCDDIMLVVMKGARQHA